MANRGELKSERSPDAAINNFFPVGSIPALTFAFPGPAQPNRGTILQQFTLCWTGVWGLAFRENFGSDMENILLMKTNVESSFIFGNAIIVTF